MSMMQTLENEVDFDWIRNARAPWAARTEPSWSGVTIRNLLPDCFEAYAKILCRIGPNFDVFKSDQSLSMDEKRILQLPESRALKSLVHQLHDSSTGVPSNIRWSTLAELLDVPFVPDITDAWFRLRLEPGAWPRYICGPDEGLLEPDEYGELVRILSGGAVNTDCFFRLAEIPFIATDQPLLFRGVVDEVLSIPVKGTWNTPEYWWSATRDWCICSDYDLSFAIAAGPRTLIEEVFASPVLETIEVMPSTRVDDLAPMPGRVV